MPEKGITIIEGDDLDFFLLALGIKRSTTDIYRLRIWSQTDGPIKVKVNERSWTYLIGRKDG
jgi:hypothetical protein